jgi:two-component system response regulator AtoC
VGNDFERNTKLSQDRLQPVCILIIDDRATDRISNEVECKRIFRHHPGGLVIDQTSNIDDAITKMAVTTYQIVLLDKDLGRDAKGDLISGTDYIRLLQEVQPVSKIIMLTASEKPSEISKALRLGAYDYIIKGADEERAGQREAALRRAFQSSMDSIELTIAPQLITRDAVYGEFICRSSSMVRFDQKVKAVADSHHPALLLGETGIGKGAIARRINEFRSNALKFKRPFVNINIGAMPDNLAQSELFGQDPYSFTGSGSKTKTGLLDMAKNGDIFLDEVGDASPEMQLRLLKVVEEKEYIRVGGRQPIKTNARFIFATNKNIKDLVAQGKFREDLYMRIAALELEVPSLEERKEDLPHIIESICKRIRDTKPEKQIFFRDMPEDMARYLTRDSIPGNIRGIQNAIERFATFTLFDKQGLPDYKNWKSILGLAESTPRRKARDTRLSLSELATIETDLIGAEFPGYKQAQKVFERRLIEEALLRFGNLTKAAGHLGLSKGALSLKMKAMNMRQSKEAKNEFRPFGNA